MDIKIEQLILALAGIAFVIFIALSIFVAVPAGYKGVLLEWGKVEGTLDPGLHIVMPIVNSVVKMETRTQKYEVKAEAVASSLQDAITSVALNFRISEDIQKLYQGIGPDYVDRIIAPAVQEVVKASTAKYSADELISNRPQVKSDIEAGLKSRLAQYDITVEAVSLTNYKFSDRFTEAIEEKMTAQQNLVTIETQAKQKIVTAEADAKVIQIMNEQLEKSPKYIELLAVQRWDTHLPSVVGGAMPFVQIPIYGNRSVV